MRPSTFLSDVATRERTKYRIHTVLGLSVLAVYGGIIAFAFYVMSSSNMPSANITQSVQAASVNDATNSTTLTWTAPGYNGSVGTAASYDIRYSTGALNAGTWGLATSVTGIPAPKVAGSAESMLVTGLQPNTTYNFGLITTDAAGNPSALSNIATKTTSTISIPTCVEAWSCGAWSTCTGGTQTRSCTDAKACGTTTNKPATSQSCSTGVTGGTGGTPVDSVAPNTVLTAAPTAPVTTSVFHFTWVGNDDQTSSAGLQFSYQLDQQPWTSWTGSTSVTLHGLLSGTHTFAVRSRDNSGNVDPSPSKVTFTVKLISKVVVSQESGSTQVAILNSAGKSLKTFNAFETSFKGGVRVQVGDLGGNGTNEIVAVPGPGRVAEIRIFRMDGTRIASYQPFGANYKDGLALALANVDGTGVDRIIVSKQKGSAVVRTFGFVGGKNTQVYSEFNASTSNANGGISVAAGDVNGDGKDEINTAPYSNARATISAYSLSGKRFVLLAQAVNVFTGTKLGVSIATGDLKNTGTATILAGLRTGNTTVKQLTVSGKKLVTQKALLIPFSGTDRNGVRVSTGDVNGDGKVDILIAHGSRSLTQLFFYSGSTLKRSGLFTVFGKSLAILSTGVGY